MFNKLSDNHYTWKKDKSKGVRRAKRLGWDIDEKYSNDDVITYTKGNQVHINYAGTNVFNPRDLISDVMLATGRKSADFTSRKRRTREIMRGLGDDKQYSLSGHSLGGSIGLHIMKDSKSIRDRTNEAHFYNPGLTQPFVNSIKANKNLKKELNDKVTIHRVEKDIVSEGATPNFGEVKEYEGSGSLLDRHTIGDNFD